MYKIVAADSSEPKCSDSNSYEIEASDSLETKRSDSNSEKSDALPAIDTHHPGKSQGVARAGILSFITKH